MRQILVHLNVALADADERSMEEVIEALSGALEVGSDDEAMLGLEVTIPLAEELS